MNGALGTPELYGYSLREELYPGEESYFKNNPQVAGMAADDGKVILNPYSPLSKAEKGAVAKNEAIRLFMREQGVTPEFELSKNQIGQFAGTKYAENLDALKQSIVARILSGDPSANATEDQISYANQLLSKIEKRSGLGSPTFNGLRHYGWREDGSPKQSGWQGELMRRGENGMEMRTEYTGDFGRGEIPTITPLGEDDGNAIAWHKARMKQGLSPFYEGYGLRPGRLEK